MYVDEIRAYTPQNEQEAADQRLILEYIRLFPDNILTRDNEIAHLSSSGFVVNADGTRVLMAHHNIYRVWAWTGGHADGEGDLLSVALWEAREETGVEHIRPLSPAIASLDILPVWGHVKRGKWVPSHQHLNVSYLLVADERDASRSGRGRTAGWAGFRRSACWSTPTSGRWTACTPSCWPGRGSCCGTHKWIAWTCPLENIGTM